MEFTEQVFNILLCNLENGESYKTEVLGYIAGDTGLGYYYDLDQAGNEVYVVTHLASGYSMGAYSRFFHQEDAENFIKAVAPLTDWKQPTKAMYEASQNQELREKMKQALYSVIGGPSNFDKKISRYSKSKYQQLKERAKEVAEAS